MTAEKSIVTTGYTVIPAENGGFIVEGKGVNTGVRHAFSNVREYLEFVCSQHTGDEPMHYFNENWCQDFIKRSAELSLKAGQSLGGSIDYPLYPKTLCDKSADVEKADAPAKDKADVEYKNTVFQWLYDHEINISISSFWDGGFRVAIGDEMNGYQVEGNVRGWDNVEAWFETQAHELFEYKRFY